MRRGEAKAQPPTPRPVLLRVDIRPVKVEVGAPTPPLPPLPRPRLVKIDVKQVEAAAAPPQSGGEIPVPRPKLLAVRIREVEIEA